MTNKRVCPNCHIVTYSYTTNHNRTTTYCHVVTNNGLFIVMEAFSSYYNMWIAYEIIANVLCVQMTTIIMNKMSMPAYCTTEWNFDALLSW